MHLGTHNLYLRILHGMLHSISAKLSNYRLLIVIEGKLYLNVVIEILHGSF